MNTLLITAAGRASRFHDVGYDQPKYLLPWVNSKTILTNIVQELTLSKHIGFLLIIANYREKYFKSDIEKSLGDDINYKLIFIKDTLGQAQTTYLGVEELCSLGYGESPMIVHNSDTILKNRDIKALTNFNDKKVCGYVNTFQSNDKNYSYILESDNFVKTFLEKKAVSPLASSGLVSFSSPKKFRDIYNKSQGFLESDKELYMSSLINSSIKQGEIFLVNHSNNIEDTIVLGTPEEYCKAYTLEVTGLKDNKL